MSEKTFDNGEFLYPGIDPHKLVADTLANGGSTTFASGKSPTSGTSVSLPGHEERVPTDDFGVTDVMRYMHTPENHAKLTGRPNRALGMWADTDESGKPHIFQDVSRVFKDTPRSNRLARTSAVGGNQMGIYNIETFTTEYNPTHPDVLKRAGGNVELDPGEAERYTTSEAPVGTEVVTGATTETQRFSRGRGRKKAVVPAGQGTFIFTGAGSQLQPPPTTKK